MRNREMNTTSMKSNSTLETVHKPKIKIEYGEDYKFVQDVVSSNNLHTCLLYTSPSPRDGLLARMPSSA